MNIKNLVLVTLTALTVGCSTSREPTVKRVANFDQIDQQYLKNVFVPSYTGPKLQLLESIRLLNENWAEFRDIMSAVEAGRIPVKQGFKGDWRSIIKQDGNWIAAAYSDRLGLIVDFQKHKDIEPYPLIYGFTFSSKGILVRAITMSDEFRFDEQGRVIEYRHE